MLELVVLLGFVALLSDRLVGAYVGAKVAFGGGSVEALDGTSVGWSDGTADGKRVGTSVVGSCVGICEGTSVGLSVGVGLGMSVGS